MFRKYLPLALWAVFQASPVGRVLLWVWKFLSTAYFLNWLWNLFSGFFGFLYNLLYWLHPDLWLAGMKGFLRIERDYVGAISANVHMVLNKFMGVPISAGTVTNITDGAISPNDLMNVGDAIASMIKGVFDIDAVARGYQTREPGTAESDNFSRFIGMHSRLQIGSMVAELLKDRLPLGTGHGISSIAEHLHKLVGLEDAQEEILEPLMEKLIVEGWTKGFNRQILGVDLTPGDAVDAYIRNLLPEGSLNKILDNEGIRPDIRPILFNLRAKNLTEADFRDLYQRGMWSRDDVFAGYRLNGYVEDDAQLKTSLILQDREFQLRKELLNVKESQFVAGVLDEGSLRNYLATLSFTAEEEDIEIEIAKGKASLRTTTRPKQITGTFNVAPWRVRPGATAMMSWNIRNAENITISGIGTVGARGERVITPDISQTYVLTAESDTDSERFEAAVQVGETRELKRPTVTFSASPGRITIGTPVELKWTTGNAETVSIDGIGQVGEAGAMAVFPFLSTIYTLRATNAQGTTVRQDIVFVELPDVDFDRERRPSISFSITPGVVRAAQPQAELNWSITRADEGRLTFPDGNTQTVSRNGALIVTATASGIYTLRASNLFGETQNQEALIFQGAEEETP